MKLKKLPSEFQKALPILEKIKSEGFEAYFVGGSVRDVLLNRPIHDVDIATSSYPEETKAIFPRTVDIGIEHGTVLVLTDHGEYEVTTFRTEDLYVDFRRPKQVQFVRSLEEDLKRRDFTINAFALDDTGELVDLFNGLEDLENKILRAVGKAEERFSEDALRIMRGLRFAANLGFEIEKKTFSAMCDQVHLLEKISVERSFIEFEKLLLGVYWRRGLQDFLTSKAYRYLPEMEKSKIALGKLLSDLSDNFLFKTSEQAFAALLICLLPDDPKKFLRSWKTSNDFQKKVIALLEIYRERERGRLDKLLIYQYGFDLIMLCEQLREGLGLSTAFSEITALDQALEIHHKNEIHVNGGDLMRQFQLKPGPELGQLLGKIELSIVEGKLTNDSDVIMAFVEKELASG